jgi:hypothetical protein
VKARFLYRVGAFALLSLALIGCGAPAISPTPTAATHSWPASPVVASLYHGPGYTSRSDAWSAMPSLVVYADGRVIVTSFEQSGSEYLRSVELAQIAPAEVCSLLGAIDGYGFFDYDSDDYPRPQITDNGTTQIKVDAWRSMDASAYALHYVLGEPDLLDSVPSSLVETYRLLSDFSPPNRAPYRPERISLLIETTTSAEPAADWPLAAPSLKELLASMNEDTKELVLDGQQAADVYALFGKHESMIYSDGVTRYTITLRPLLPLEIWGPEQGWGRNSEFDTAPTVDLTCTH